MAEEFDIVDFIKNETDIEKVKERLFVFYNILAGSMKEISIYQFLIGMFNLNVVFEHVEKPLVSIVIPVKNEYIMTEFLLNSIHSYTKNIPYEIIIADDNSDDQTTEIENCFPNITVVKNDINTPGFLFNVNNAINHARGKYILLLNNDMMVLENYLEELIKVIEGHDDIGIVGAKTIGLDNKIQECGCNIKKDGEVEFIAQNKEPDYLDDKEYTECDYCSGCSILFKKDTWDKAGGFDKNFAPAYFEDSDFAFNVKYNLGLKSVCVPKSKIYHYKQVSYMKDIKSKGTITSSKNYFIKKWANYLK